MGCKDEERGRGRRGKGGACDEEKQKGKFREKEEIKNV